MTSGKHEHGFDGNEADCMLCAFYYVPDNEHPYTGECRKNPPRGYVDKGNSLRFYPKVSHTDWCGQFRKIADEKIYVERHSKLPWHDNSKKMSLLGELPVKDSNISLIYRIFKQVNFADLGEKEKLLYQKKLHRVSEKLHADEEYEMSHHLFTLLSNLGDPHAAFLVGLYYFKGMGTQVDNEKSEEYFDLACERGHKRALENKSKGFTYTDEYHKKENET